MTIKTSKSSRVKKARKTSSVNTSFQNEIFFTTSEIVSCDGLNLALGHPKVYLKLQENAVRECPYCSQKFQKKSICA